MSDSGMEPQDYVPVIGTSFLYPIATLLEQLLESAPTPPNPVQTSSQENGYSASVILLSVAMLESILGRTQYLAAAKPDQTGWKYLETAYGGEYPVARLQEIFVVRDVIAHNHVWDVKMRWDASGKMELLSASLREGYGDKKFRHVVDQTTRCTRQLELNAFPTRIWARDAIVCLQEVVKFALFLERKDRRAFPMSMHPVEFRGEVVGFADMVTRLEVPSNGPLQPPPAPRE